jgi:tRNA (guanine-N7-)-methyltransferase
MDSKSISKLPLVHPHYRYPTAKNPYALKLKEHPGWAYSDNDIEEFAGHWREKFLDQNHKPSRKLIVEVGCNTGHVVREWALANPKNAYIGIDWKFKIIHRGVEKAQSKGLKNLIFMRGNVDRIRYMFGPEEIDEIHMYFPDPWPKKSQRKNRTIQARFLKDAAFAMKPDGLFFIKTDHDGYFEWMLEEIKKVEDIWTVEKVSMDLHAGNLDAAKLEIPVVTLFEKLFIKDAIPIKAVWLRRK